MTQDPAAGNPSAGRAVVDRPRLARLIGRERATYAERHPASRHAFAAAGANLLGGVPMTWMRMWPRRVPVLPAAAAHRRRVGRGR